MKHKKEKLRAQVKSRFYYIFWGAATCAVVFGQILVASSYLKMAETMELFIVLSIDKQLKEPLHQTKFLP